MQSWRAQAAAVTGPSSKAACPGPVCCAGVAGMPQMSDEEMMEAVMGGTGERCLIVCIPALRRCEQREGGSLSPARTERSGRTSDIARHAPALQACCGCWRPTLRA